MSEQSIPVEVRARFLRLSGGELSPGGYTAQVDGFPLRHDDVLLGAHQHVSRTMARVAERFPSMSFADEFAAVSVLASDRETMDYLGSLPASGRGLLWVATVERTLWRSALGAQVGNSWRFSSTLYSLGKLILATLCVLPEEHLAKLLVRACDPHFGTTQAPIGNIASMLPQLLRAVPNGRPFAAAFGPELRAAFEVVASRLDELADGMFAFEGGRKTRFDGVPLDRLCAALRGEGLPGATAQRDRPLLDLDKIPRRAAKSRVARATSKVSQSAGARALRLGPVQGDSALARALFGEAVTQKLQFRELSLNRLQVLESVEMNSVAAAKVVAAATERRGVYLALVSQSISDSPPTTAIVRRALDAEHDDDAFCDWLRAAVDARRSELEAMKSALEEEAREVATQRPPKPRPWKKPARLRIVAISGATSAVLPALYGLGPFNDCPSPVVHAAVLGRWGREFGARVRSLTRDSISIQVAQPPHDALRMSWAALAAGAYCPSEPAVVAGLRWLRSAHWTFWWD